jgi:hypothetical protein
MKKTNYIQLVLITAALASCNRYFNQSDPPEYQEAYPQAEAPDSTNSCPLAPDDLPPDYYTWYYGFQPYGVYFDDPFYLEGYYYYRDHVIIRHGFGTIARTGHGGHAVHA